jgi:stress response protein SCP2
VSIPATTQTYSEILGVAGTYYYRTVTQSGACDIKYSEPDTVTVKAVELGISQANNVLIANATPATYQWINCATHTPIAGQINQSYTATQNGSYAVKISQNGCTDTSACVSLINPFPDNGGIISGAATVCQGQNSVTYTIPVIANATTYLWTLPTGATGTSTTNSITVNYGVSAVGGNITVKGHNATGDGAASTLAITVNPLPAAAGTITGTATICPGQNSVSYSVPAIANATSYIWTLPTGATGTSTTNSISVNYGISAASGNITVKGHNNCGDGVTSTFAVTVNPLPVIAGTITGITTVCQGQNSVGYTVPAITNATTYIWNIPSGATGTSTTNSITVNYGTSAVSGNITVKGHNDCGDGIVSTLAVTVNPLPAGAGVITGNTAVCQMQNLVSYTVPSINNATSYIWTLPAGATGTSTTNTITVNYGTTATSGNITVKGHNDCGDGAVSTLAVTVNPLPVNAGTITGTSMVCNGQNAVSYSVPAITNATSCVWSLPTGVTGTSTTNTNVINYGASAVSGNITVKGHNSCGDGATSALAVTVNPKPVTPVVTVNGIILHSNATNGNQWYKSSSLITGATSQDYTFTAIGDYTVVVTQNGCASDPSVISVVTGLDPLDYGKKISVYPNPVTNELIIESEGNTQKIDFVIVSATGQVVYTGYLYEKVVIPTTGYATGLYFIKLKSGKIIEFKKIVKL